jgi:hypothetical protein
LHCIFRDSMRKDCDKGSQFLFASANIVLSEVRFTARN